MTVRINARLDKKLADEVEAVRRRTGKTLTQVIEESLQLYCQTQREAGAHGGLAGFVGCADGPEDLSVRYKAEFRRGLGRKA
jgi:hypothetical protein